MTETAASTSCGYLIDENEKIVHGGVNHYGIIVKDTEKSKEFLTKIFDFVDDSHTRPDLPFPGAFMKFGPHQIHLMQIPDPDEGTPRPEHGGRDRHMAVSINNIDILRRRLEKNNIPYTTSKSGRRSIFCRDIDGNAFEFVEVPSLNEA